MSRSARSISYAIDHSRAIDVLGSIDPSLAIPAGVRPIYYTVGLNVTDPRFLIEPDMKIELRVFYRDSKSTNLDIPADAHTYKYVITEDDIYTESAEDKYKLFAFAPPPQDKILVVAGVMWTPAGELHQIFSYDNFEGAFGLPDVKNLVIGEDGDKLLTPDEIKPEAKQELVKVKFDLPEGMTYTMGFVINSNTMSPDKKEVVQSPTEEEYEKGYVERWVPAPAEGEELAVDVFVVDRYTNRSQGVHGEAVRDNGVAPNVEIALNVVANDDIVNAQEATRDITVSGRVSGDFKAGDSVTLTIGGKQYVTTVDAEGNFSKDIPGADLATSDRVSATITVTADNGKSATANAERPYTVDFNAPEVRIELDNITADNIINAQEANGTLVLTGRVGGDLAQGDTVKIHLDPNTVVNATVQADKTFSVELTNPQVQVLVNNPVKEIQAVAVKANAAGNAGEASVTKAYGVDTQGPDIQIVLNKIAGDNVVTSQEADKNIVVSGKVTGDFAEGDKVIIYTGHKGDKNYQFTARVDAEGNFAVTFKPEQAKQFLLNNNDKNVYATMTKADAAGNVTDVVAKQTYTSQIKEVGETISLVRLDGDLTLYSGLSKVYYKNNDYGYTIQKGGNGKPVQGLPYLLTDKDDTLLIGWKEDGSVLKDNQVSGQRNTTHSGNFQNWADNGSARLWDSMDGTHNGASISTIDTGRGDDVVRIRGHQQQATRVYLGEGNDTYELSGKLTAAQAGAWTSAAVFGENGNDNITVKGDVHQAYIIGGSGSDTITLGGSVYGNTIISVDNDTHLTGGAYVSHYKFAQAYGLGNDTGRDQASDVNSVTINGSVGLGVGVVKIYGGESKDTITIKDTLTKASIETLGGNDVLAIEKINTNAMTKIDMGAGKDTLQITGKGQTLDLTKVFGVETVDVGGSGKNVVKLTAQSLKQNANLHIKGDSDDVVDVIGNAKNYVPTKTGTQVEDGITYNVYKVDGVSSDNLLYVQQGVAVI